MPESIWKNRPFLTLWAGQTVSALGNAFTSVAMAWYVYVITGSEMALGGMLLANVIPLTFMRLFAGVLVDRWDRRWTMIVTDGSRVLCLGAAVATLAVGNEQLWYLYVLNMLLGVLDAFFQPAAFALLPSLVRDNQLVKVNSFLNMAVNGSMILGPALAGLIITAFGAAIAMGIDGVTFAISGISLLLLPRMKVASSPTNRRFFHEVADGFIFFLEQRGLLWLLVLVGVSNITLGMVLPLVLPYSIHVLHAGVQGYGLLQTAIGTGFMLGSLVAMYFKHYARRKVMIPANILSGLMFICFSFWDRLWFALLCAIGYGMGVAVWNVFSSAFYQELVPEPMRGRVQSVRLLLAQGSIPVGIAIGPALSGRITVIGVFIFSGCAIIVSGLLAYSMKSLKVLDALDHVKASVTP